MRALVPDFNRVILEFAPLHVARIVAPGTLAELRQCAALGGPLVVWEGESARTVYGCARVNHAFRAWHDAEHVAGGYAFNLEGERAACEAQALAVLRRYPSAPRRWLALLRAEIIGQAEHFARFGAFPSDQIEFMRQTLEVAQ